MRSCHCCGLVQTVPPVPQGAMAECRRCRTRLRLDEDSDNGLSAAIGLAALVLFVPAITLPFLTIEQLGHTRESSLIGGVIALLAHGYWFVGLMVFLFSVVVPPLKLIALLALGTISRRLRAHVRADALRAVEQLGRWGMLDVLLVAVLLTFIKLGGVIAFHAGPGVVAFSVFVLLSMLAAYFFDPHALWDEGPMSKDVRSTGPENDVARPVTAAGEPPRDLPQADVVRRRSRAWVWILPLLAAVGAGVLVYRSWVEQGTLITVTFSEGHGLKGGDQVRYRGTVVGSVERIVLSGDLDVVRAEVRLRPGTESLAREGSRFWVVRPTLALTGVSGLETVVGANYLTVLPGATDAPPKYAFIGLEEPPLEDIREAGGVNIVLEAADASGLSTGSGVYYRQLRVGGVRKVALANDASSVEVHAYIRPAFRQLVLPDAKFWKTAGIKVRADWSGFSLEVGSAQSLLQSGIALAIPGGAATMVEQGHRFVLNEQPQEEWLAWRPSLGTGTVPTNLPQPTWAILQWALPGYLYSSEMKRIGWVLAVDGGLIGPAGLLSEPESAEENSAALSLAGETIAIRGEARAAGVGLAQIEATLADRPVVPVTLRETESPEDVLIVADPGQGPVFVAADRLAAGEGAWQIDEAIPLDPSWQGVPAVSVEDGAVVGFLLLDDGPPRVALYRTPAEPRQDAQAESPPGSERETAPAS